MSTREEPALTRVSTTGYQPTVASLTEEEYRQWIEHTFQPIFEPYEQVGGIPCRELLSRFQYQGMGLPQDRRKELILYLDANRDGRITFEKFRSALVHKRYVDLAPYQRFGMRVLLVANPGLRLAAARTRAIKHLQTLDALGRGGLITVKATARLPNAITGYAGDCEDGGDDEGFRLENDGVWPTSRIRRGQLDGGITIMEEEYIPEIYLQVFNCRPPPIFCPLLVLIQLGVFIYYAVELSQRAEAEPYNALTWISGFPYFSPLYFDPRRRREVWRFLTYMLVHQGIWHILFNSTVTLLLGSLMEWGQGAWRIGVIYTAGVLAGSLAISVWDPRTVGVGASGGVYALLSVHLALLAVVNWEEVKHDFTAVKHALTFGQRVRAVAISAITRICLILILFFVDFGFSLYERFGLSEAPLRVSFSPIFAGVIAGVIVGVPLVIDFRGRPWERVIFWVCLGISLALLIFTIFWNIFWPGYPTQLI